eukprot:1986562-Lingulodinium_polyedra.AAC.1
MAAAPAPAGGQGAACTVSPQALHALSSHVAKTDFLMFARTSAVRTGCPAMSWSTSMSGVKSSARATLKTSTTALPH